jgi:hypothetical protein
MSCILQFQDVKTEVYTGKDFYLLANLLSTISRDSKLHKPVIYFLFL